MNSPHIDRLDADTYTARTPGPEADGTLQWDATTGLGWTYSSPAAAAVVAHELRDVMVGRETADITGAFEAMHRACRNYGTRGLVTQAISAVDIALWDLDAQLRNGHRASPTMTACKAEALPACYKCGCCDQCEAVGRRWTLQDDGETTGSGSVEGREIARSDRQAVVKAHQLANEAAVWDFANELSHQLKVNEIQRRGRRALDVMHGQAALMSVAQTLAHGDPTKQMEYLDVYNAWKQGEIYRIATE